MVFDPISAAITAGVALMDMGSKAEQNKTAQANLAETRRMNDAMIRMAKAGRTDPFGNRTTFDDALNEWITQLTPEQASLIKAGEREQRLGLTEDAARNRIINAMLSRTGRQAGDILSRNLSSYGAGAPSEGATRAELTRLINLATPQVGTYRSTQPGGAIISGGGGGEFDPKRRLAQILLQARGGALGETGTREGQRQQQYLGPNAQLAQLMQGGRTNVNIPNTAAGISAQSDALSQNLAKVMQNAASNQMNAFGDVTKTSGGGPDLRGIAALYASMARPDKATKGSSVRNLPNLVEPDSRRSFGPIPGPTYNSPDALSWMESAQYPMSAEWGSTQSWW